MRSFAALIALTFAFSVASRAGDLPIQPTTTLAALTSNNTSASAGFRTQSNGNLGAGNVSKVDVHSLLYPGSTTKVFAHLVLWFGQSDHMNIGYSSNDAAHVKQQINDMISRGIDGVVMVWYGPGNAIDHAAQLVMNEAEQHPGFTFALMIDHGAIEWHSCSGCAPQQALTQQLQYIEQTYFQSPAYLRFNGQPVVTNFDIDIYYTIDWNALKKSLSSNPNFIFQNSSGFTHTASDGAYSWVMPTSSGYGMSYLKSFYQTDLVHSSTDGLGAAYKGFNDKLASWSLNRTMDQQCGQTWLQTFSQINGIYNSGNQLPSMQLVTWNDYEEGTEIESGIDNCLSLSTSISGSSLAWKVNGNENTLDHYTVYVSTDGQNLMPLQDAAVGTHSVDLCGYSLGAGKYSLFVQGVGRPTVINHITGPVAYSPSCGGSPGPPVPTPPGPTPPGPPSPSPKHPVPPTPVPESASLGLASSPSFMTISQGGTGNSKITVSPKFGTFNRKVSLACTNLPLGVTCSFSPSVVTPGSGPVSSKLTVSTNLYSASMLNGRSGGTLSLYGLLVSFPMAGLVIGGVAERKKLARILAVLGIAAGSLALSSCGGTATPTAAKAVKANVPYQITIHAVSGTTQASTVASVTFE